MTAPVAMFIFNRPDLTRRVFSRIAAARPPHLLVVADAPRTEEEARTCAEARAVLEQVDWRCEVSVNFSDVNLGPRRRFASGLAWVFDRCEEAILLEHDCLPHPTFFRFCTELLERYRKNERVMMVSGDNFQVRQRPGRYSYCFSRYSHIWGWASWRRAWRHYDAEMKLWPSLRGTGWLREVLGDEAAACWEGVFERVYGRQIDTWDYQWQFACFVMNGLSVIPCVNLVSNMGFDPRALHTTSPASCLANLPAGKVRFPLRHPPSVVPDVEADRFTMAHVYGVGAATWPLPAPVRVLRALVRRLPAPVQAPVSDLWRRLSRVRMRLRAWGM